jgi:phosphoribosylglycinamide formyltransferase-1
MPTRFISEPIEPIELANVSMAAGEPALPQRFKWREVEYEVAESVSTEREFRPEGHRAGNELYLRKHWVEVITTTGERMKLYCERQARGRNRMQRWWLYSVTSDE